MENCSVSSLSRWRVRERGGQSLRALARPAKVMLEKVLQFFLIACSHRKLSRPHVADFDDGRNADWMPVGNGGPSHYVVCLDCGKKFDYDWREMRVVR